MNTDSPPPSLDDLIREMENVRLSLVASARRLRRTRQTDNFTPDMMYHEIGDMRSCAQALNAVVDNMFRLCFPLRLDPTTTSVLKYVTAHSPVPKLIARMQIGHEVKSTDLADKLINRLIEANYIRNTNTNGRDMLEVTDTGKAADAGIMWAML